MSAVTNDMQAFLTGNLIGHVMQESVAYKRGEGFMKITNVVPDMDDDGNYLSSFTVTFESGLQLSVNVLEMTTIPEEEV